MNYNTYTAFTRRTLFPPVVSNSIPAFDGKKEYQIFFKKSAANFVSGGQGGSFKHIQISIRRIDNNTNAINTETHRTGYIIAPLSTEAVDEPGFIPQVENVYRIYSRDEKTPYVVFLSGLGSSFTEMNTLYKVQIRLGEEEYNPNWGVADIQRMNTEGTVSEWSSVLTMKPIDAPSFGLQGFKDTVEDIDKKGNEIATANFEYVAYYDSTYVKLNENGEPVITTVNEKLSEYSFKLLDASGKLLSDSGPIVTIEHDRPSLSHSFDYLTEDGLDYFVVFKIKTENGYVGEKKYLIKAKYKILQMSNAMVRVTNETDMARIKVEVKAKQVVLEPIIKKGTENELSKLGFVFDEGDPQYDNLGLIDQSKISTTHAVIEGSVQASKSFYLSCPNDIWVLESKIAGLKSFKTREEALRNPYIVVENDFTLERDVLYMTRMKLICYEKKEFDFGLDLTQEPIVDEDGIKRFPKSTTEPKTIYYLEAVKTSYKKQNGQEIEIATQVKKVRSAVKTKFNWPENVDKFELPVLPSLNRYVYDEGRYDLITIPELKLHDIAYTNKTNPEEPIIVSQVSHERRTFSANESIPFNPYKEYYIYISNNLGSFAMYMFDDGYITNHESFMNYLDTKLLSPEMEIETLDKFKIEKERR